MGRRSGIYACGLGCKKDKTNSKQAGLHPSAPLVVTIEPPLRPPEPRIFAENISVPMHDPRTHADDGPAGESLPTHCRAFGRHDAFQRQPERRVQTAGFFDARVEVGEGARLLECDGSGGGGRREGVELGEEAG